MRDAQFRVLYRQFLFRMVDLELLSADAQGDMNKLFGQFAALLIFISILLSIVGGAVGGTGLILEWSGVHFMIATMMLVVGLFAILSWDSTFPDERDVMVLAPLPIRNRTVFLAKVAAVATALSVTIVTLQALPSFVWSMALNHHHRALMAPSIAFDAAMPPLDVAALEPVLKHDLQSLPGAQTGVTAGVWKHGEQRVFAYGTAKPDSIFEIGSITKTFTALALAQLAVQGKARLDEPVRELLPPGTVDQPEGREVTLQDLATHRSGLPGYPSNLHSTDKYNPYAEYETGELYAFMKEWGVAKPASTQFAYNNMGFALLGEALANRAGVTYAEMIRGITEPLGMHDTVVQLSPEQRHRLMQGYSWEHTPVGLMDLRAFEGAGAIRSTAGDMLRYLAVNLHPAALPETTPLRAAIEVQRGAKPPLSWFHDEKDGSYWHDGATSGYTSYSFFSPKDDVAVVTLANIGAPDLLFFAGSLGEHIRERLAGERAISLKSVEVPAGGGGVLGFLRQFAAWWITMLMAGAFIFCCVLGAQGLAAQLLPRRHFLRVSSWMQLAAFGILVAAYFLEPKIVTPSEFIAPENSAYLAWSPSYWFLGLFQQLNGSPALADLATRAWQAIGITFGCTVTAYTLAYLRTMRKIVEEPDITPVVRGRRWAPRFGDGFETAIGQFSLRTLFRSRQHRLMLAFYGGIGFAVAILFPQWPVLHDLSGGMPGVSLSTMAATILIVILMIVGTRVVFSLPVDMRANWIFRITPYPDGPDCMKARRRALYALSLVPVLAGCAVVLFTTWPRPEAAKHLAVLLLFGIIVAELCLRGSQKLPFTCSYLPGKSNFNMTFLICSSFIFTGLAELAKFERESFAWTAAWGGVLALLAILAIAVRWSASRLAASPEGALQFEESAEPAVLALDLFQHLK